MGPVQVGCGLDGLCGSGEEKQRAQGEGGESGAHEPFFPGQALPTQASAQLLKPLLRNSSALSWGCLPPFCFQGSGSHIRVCRGVLKTYCWPASHQTN